MRTIACVRKARLSLGALLFLMPLLLMRSVCAAQAPADFNVNSVADKVDASPGDGICSTGALLPDGHTQECTLRAAIDETNALQVANPAASYVVSVMAGTYSLTTSEKCVYRDFGNPNYSTTTTAVLCITSNLTLNGAGQATTIVDHALIDRDFFVSYGYTEAINNMTIQNGGQYGGSYDGAGGGINNQGNLTLSNDLLYKNHSDVGGAGIDNLNILTVEGCTFLANSGPGLSAENATTSVDTSYFTQNTAGGGAAVSIFTGSLQISNSTASGNTVTAGGVIATDFTVVSITNSTISDNTIGNSGAVSLEGGSSLLNNVTISGNTAGNSVGGLIGDTITMSNTILAGNTGDDCAVSDLTDAGHNLVQTPDVGDCTLSSPTTLVGVDAKLGTLALDGGLVPTQEPLPGSPAIGAGSGVTPGHNAAGACTALDERGFVRGRSGTCTIGATEPLGSFNISNINISPAVGAQGGTAWVVIYGSPFVPGSTLALQKSGQPNIPVLQSTVSADTLSLTALLDLSKAALGGYDVVVTTPANASSVLAGAYTVQMASAPNLYSYIYGPPVQRAGRPAYYTVVYGNKGNADAYLVPLSVAMPGGFPSLISSPVLTPPVATGQVVQDWTYVHLDVLPYSATGFSNVPLIIPVLPAGFTGVFQFSIEAPAGTPEGTEYALDAGLGTPYGTAPSGAVAPATLAAFVAGAQSYAQNNLGVTLTASQLAQMSTYASTQLAQEVVIGGQAILQSSLGSPVLFSNAQLIIDIATYGASLANSGSNAAGSVRKGLRAFSVKPDAGGGSVAPVLFSPCTNGQSMQPGTSCAPKEIPIPGGDDPDAGDKPLTRADCENDPYYHVSADGTECVQNPQTGCSLIPVTIGPPLCQRTPITGSLDPNEKDGPVGIGSAHFTVADNPFHYQVEFENSPAATASAQTVSVTDPLDMAQYDLSTFQLGPISFGPYVLTPPPGLTSFAGALDLRPTENVIVAVSANLDKSTGVATWNFTSLDPATMQLTTDPTAGFLPPDTNPPAGIGHVAFSVQPVASVASGAQICNTASIVFDLNAALSTAPYCNSKDTTAPTSSVQPLAATQSNPTFTVSWTGTDTGVGVGTYTIYVSTDGGAFSAWLTATQLTSATYTGTAGHTYGFYSIATDLLGNTEAAKTRAEATTSVGAGQTITFGPLPNTTYPQKPITLTATASSGLPVTYSVTGPATVSGSALTLTGTGTVTVTAMQAGNATYSAAPPVSQSFTVTAGTRAAPPAFTPDGGTFPNARNVVITDGTMNATIYYTTNGSMPTTSSTKYTGPVTVSKSETLAAMAVAGNGLVSLVTEASFMIDAYTAPIAFTPGAGTYPTARTVTITDKTAGSTIYYTTNGTTPTTSSTKYTGPITVSTTETIEAIAVAPGYVTSSATAKYTIK